MRRLIVIETNEIPLTLYRWYAELKPESTIATLLDAGVVGESQVFEEADRELYPSQTWATLATGMPYEKHGVYWYGDPKPAEFPLYWQHIAEHRTVGLVGTLHSSPLGDQGGQLGLRFALPDAFAGDAEALPRSLEPLQAFNLAMTGRNSRAVANVVPISDYMAGLRSLKGAGVSVKTLARLGHLAASVASRRVAKERLRTAQFVLLADVFMRQMQTFDPDLGILFTNHVAAAMHRYWPASFPDDWSEHPYDHDWIDRFQGEIPAAMHELDRLLAETLDFCRASDRTLLLASSMGQEGGGPVDEGGDHDLVLDDADLFVQALGLDEDAVVLHAMAPHLTLRFESATKAKDVERRLGTTLLQGRPLTVDRADSTLTMTYHFRGDVDSVRIDDTVFAPAQAGFRRVAVTEHKAGRHAPRGAVIVGNSPVASMPDGSFDLEELAPAIIESLGVPELAHHRTPTLRL